MAEPSGLQASGPRSHRGRETWVLTCFSEWSFEKLREGWFGVGRTEDRETWQNRTGLWLVWMRSECTSWRKHVHDLEKKGKQVKPLEGSRAHKRSSSLASDR